MRTSYRALLAALVMLAFPASPALAKREAINQESGVAQPAPALRQTGYDLAPESPTLASNSKPQRSPAARPQRHRAAVKQVPTADLWANLPSPSMSYQAGKRGPLIQLGAFGGGMQPLRKQRDAPGNGTIAHFIVAWNF